MTFARLPVAVAVSGGADSLYALIRLHEAGESVFALHGIFMRPDMAGEQAEAAAAARRRLARICEDLGIPLHMADVSAEFLRIVIRPFVQSYADGLTPNPCALCNSRVKFGLLLDKARALGAGRLATGHYARLFQAPEEEYGPILLQGADPLKDQSYFLALAPRGQVAAAMFPLGDMHKRETISSLAERDILPPHPKESQEVCFIPGDEYRTFLPRAAEALGITLPGPGPVLLTDGSRLGEHNGLWRYTEGQRRGLGLGWKEPLHVIAKRSMDNTLLVGPKDEMRVGGCRCANLNILLPPSFWPETVLVKTRYRERPKAARASLSGLDGPGATLLLHFWEADTAIAPGQVAAVYIPFHPSNGRPLPWRDDVPLRLVAGGIISEVY